jgi:type I restriction enzyme S subunit
MSRYPERALGEVLELDINPVALDPFASYPVAGVYSLGRGLFAREAIKGSETNYRALNRLSQGMFVLNRLKAFEGAVAVVPESFDGWHLSQEFPTFSTRGILPDYLNYLAQWPEFWSRLASTSKGVGARRERLHPERLLEIRIPFPDLDEQRRIAAKLDGLLGHVVAVHARTRRVDRGRLLALLPIAIDSAFAHAGSALQPLDEVASFGPNVVQPGEPPGKATDFVGLQHIESHTGHRTGSLPAGGEKGPKRRFQPGDITYPRLRPYQNKVWLSDRHGLCSVDQYVVRPHPGVDPWLLAGAMRSLSFLRSAVDATSRLQHPRIRQRDLASLSVHVANPSQQGKLRKTISCLSDKMAAAARLRTSNDARLDALKASILNHAFNGGL